MKRESKDLKDKYGYILKLSLLLALCLHLAGFVAKKDFELRPFVPRSIKPDTIIVFDGPVTEPPPEPPEIPRPPPSVIPVEDDDPDAVVTIPELDKLWHRPPPPQIPPPDSFIIHDKPPEPIRRTNPQYPKLARLAQLEGTVFVSAYIDTTGKVIRAHVAQSAHEILDTAALQAIKQWEFSPAMNRDKPVAVWITIPITFRLKE